MTATPDWSNTSAVDDRPWRGATSAPLHARSAAWRNCDPIPPRRTEFGVLDGLEYAALALDRPRRPDIVGRADCRHTVHACRSRLGDDLSQCPVRQTASTRGRPDPVTDMAEFPHQVSGPVPQRDPTEYTITLDYPAIRAAPVATLRRCGGEPRHPDLESSYGVDVVTRQQAETVLVGTGTPLRMRLAPRAVQIDGGCDQRGHTRTVSSAVSHRCSPRSDRSAPRLPPRPTSRPGSVPRPAFRPRPARRHSAAAGPRW